MRFFLFTVFFLLNVSCFSQSLKDSLFRGKLKVDSALIIQSKGNPQYTKPDSVKKTEATAAKANGSDSLKTGVKESSQPENSSEKTALKYQDNPKTWKKFVDQYTAIINTEVLPAKKIKKGSYTVMLDYEIATDGTVSTKSISCLPSNDFLVEQIKEKMMPNAPLLAPLVRNGVAVKSGKRQMMVFTKDKN